MIIDIVGWIGLSLLLSAYLHFAIKDNLKIFFLINTFASAILTIYAFWMNDIIFLIVNGFITIVLFNKYGKECKKK